MRAKPKGFSKGSGYISLYIPTRLTIQTFSITTPALTFLGDQYGKSWFTVLLRQLGNTGKFYPVFWAILESLISILWCLVIEKRVPQSSLLSTVILIFFMPPFLAIFAVSLELVCRTESVQQRNYRLVKKLVFFDRFLTNSMFPLSHWLGAKNKFQWNGNAKKRRHSQY